MKKAILICISALLWSACIAADYKPAARYDTSSKNWVEGTLAAAKSDGQIVVRGMESPYAHRFMAYHRDYYSVPEGERDQRRRMLKEKYGDGLDYKWSDEHLDNFILTAPYPEDVRVFDEPRYGTPFDTWTFTDEKPPLRYADLVAGDRVLVSFDNNNQVTSIYRVNPVHRDNTAVGKVETPPFAPTSVPRDIDPLTGLHVMNLPSNATNRLAGSKSGSDSGHIMNSGSNSTNNPPVNPFGPRP